MTRVARAWPTATRASSAAALAAATHADPLSLHPSPQFNARGDWGEEHVRVCGLRAGDDALGSCGSSVRRHLIASPSF